MRPIEKRLDQTDPERKRKAVAEAKGPESPADLHEPQTPAGALRRVFIDAFGGRPTDSFSFR